jgi:DNA polymerase-3 subunit alpha/error-prone DNA polymerase
MPPVVTPPAETVTVLPAVAVQTCHSPGSGRHEPKAWLAAGLTQLHATADGEPLPTRILLADRGLAGLPAAIAAWGAERLAIGSLVAFPLPGADASDVLFLAPDERGYRRLCRLLSRCAEQPDEIIAWLGNGLAAPARELAPELSGLVALVRDAALARALALAGAEVRWWCHDQPDDDRLPDLPAVWLPLVTLQRAAERVGEPIRAGVARRAGHPTPTFTGLALDELQHVAERFAARPELLLAGHELLAACTYVPSGAWHMPPSLHADAAATLRTLAWDGMFNRYPAPFEAAAVERLERELAIFISRDFAGYLLTVRDLAAGRRTCGRGSGAASLVVYCLGITEVDPIKYNLWFERFISATRVDPPDLDVDFPWDERDAVFVHALQVYGREHVAMVATHNRLRPPGALRAVARAWGVPDVETTAAAKKLRNERRFGISAALPEPWPALLADAAQVGGMHLHDGLHCGGLVITPEPIRDLVPVHPAAKQIDTATMRWEEPHQEPVPAIAWEKDGAEDLGLVKIDILGNRSLAVIRDVLADLVRLGQLIAEHAWRPADDEATKATVAAGATLGCFYIESPAMRQLQAKAGSGDFDRLVVHSSIIRPAASRWIAEYLHRLHHYRRTGEHLAEWYPHPALHGLLSESYGVLSYQEDVMLVAQQIGGFSEAEANQLRKALGQFGIGKGLQKFAGKFLAGAQELRIDPKIATLVWEMISSFSGYSFAKAHSASYAMVSFQCAWLKVHAPAAFHARVIANEGGFYQPGVYVEEARRLGVEIRGPSVLASGWKTAPEGASALRLGLHLVPQVSRVTADAIEAVCGAGSCAGVADLARRCRLAPRTLLSLARCGALDDLRPDLTPAQVRWLAQTVALSGLHRGARQDELRQQWLFPPPGWDDPPVPELPQESPEQSSWLRYQALGLCADHHPLRFCARRGEVRAAEIPQLDHGTWITLVGLPVAGRQVAAATKRGSEAMGFSTLEDETGLIETVWFPSAYRQFGVLLDRGQPLLVHAQVQVEFGLRTLSVERAEALAWPWWEQPALATPAENTLERV